MSSIMKRVLNVFRRKSKALPPKCPGIAACCPIVQALDADELPMKAARDTIARLVEDKRAANLIF